MVLTERERKISFITGGALVLLLLYYFLWTPYFSRIEEIKKDTAAADKQLATNKSLFARERRLNAVWTAMRTGGLNLDASMAVGQAQHAVLNWTQSSGFNLTGRSAERQTQEGPFRVIEYEIAGTGTTPSISRLIWSLESAEIPIRLNELQVSSHPEGSDVLTVRLSISVLCLPPGADQPKQPDATADRAMSDTDLARSAS